jgi:hypothetical protein
MDKLREFRGLRDVTEEQVAHNKQMAFGGGLSISKEEQDAMLDLINSREYRGAGEEDRRRMTQQLSDFYRSRGGRGVMDDPSLGDQYGPPVPEGFDPESLSHSVQMRAYLRMTEANRRETARRRAEADLDKKRGKPWPTSEGTKGQRPRYDLGRALQDIQDEYQAQVNNQQEILALDERELRIKKEISKFDEKILDIEQKLENAGQLKTKAQREAWQTMKKEGQDGYEALVRANEELQHQKELQEEIRRIQQISTVGPGGRPGLTTSDDERLGRHMGEGLSLGFMHSLTAAVYDLRFAFYDLGVTIVGAVDSGIQGFSRLFAETIVLGTGMKKLWRSIKELAKSLAIDLMQSLIQTTIKMAIFGAIIGAGGGSPPGAFNPGGSLFNALQAPNFTPGGRARGGYTGDGPTMGVAGFYHNREYVLSASATSMWGRHNLDRMNAGLMPTFAGGGGGGGGINVQVHNYGSNRVEVQQLSPDEIRVMIHEEAPKATASSLGKSSNTAISRSISRHTNASRRRV